MLRAWAREMTRTMETSHARLARSVPMTVVTPLRRRRFVVLHWFPTWVAFTSAAAASGVVHDVVKHAG